MKLIIVGDNNDFKINLSSFDAVAYDIVIYKYINVSNKYIFYLKKISKTKVI
jgi:hypothetical protein